GGGGAGPPPPPPPPPARRAPPPLAYAGTRGRAYPYTRAPAGGGALRLSPQQCDMVAVTRLFRDVIDGKLDAAAGAEQLTGLYPVPVANGFLYAKPGSSFVAAAGEVHQLIPAS
ncbi:hypothetical protein P3G22_08295, partial [Rhodopseudomonas sp. BAL398]|nr:hypothetical protein [Rhodopseudomonas sp. BAL398]